MKTHNLFSISPIDGRYSTQTNELQNLFSEYALIKNRLLIEIKWFIKIAQEPKITNLKSLSNKNIRFLQNIFDNFSLKDALKIKQIEKIINHDVKSIEYFLKTKIKNNSELKKYSEFVHFALTSEDVNNLAYGLMITESRDNCLLVIMQQIIEVLKKLAHKYAAIPMLAKTHGQSASPTTIGKEIANFVFRLQNQFLQIKKIKIMGKCNGAVGNFNAHFAAIPDFAWESFCHNFVTELNLDFNLYTTQIEPHDYIAELSHTIIRFNNILLGLNRDFWQYISQNYFISKINPKEVGSSTMPHKVNPIDFENSEGNLGIANSLFEHFANKLPISRLQRDLSDSTVMRNIGVAFAHSLIAYKAILQGIKKLEVNVSLMKQDLEQHQEILAEAIQTVMRRFGVTKPYEKLKQLTRGKNIDANKLKEFISNLPIPKQEKIRLINLTPKNYLGIAPELAKKI